MTKYIIIGLIMIVLILTSAFFWQKNETLNAQIVSKDEKIKLQNATIKANEQNKIDMKELNNKYQQAKEDIIRLKGGNYEKNKTKCLVSSDEQRLDNIVDLYNSRMRSTIHSNSEKILPTAGEDRVSKTDWKIDDWFEFTLLLLDLNLQYFGYEQCYESSN